MKELRVATYNIHKCVGMDLRFAPERIAEVLHETKADVIALQEVVCQAGSDSRKNQGEFIAKELGMDFRLGQNRTENGGDYGNVILSRFPIKLAENHDITVDGYEPRGCLSAEIDVPDGSSLNFINVHMGTSYFERRKQVQKLLETDAIAADAETAKRIVAGDFNEWINGLATRLFRERFACLDPKEHLGRRSTFPGILPVLHLDNIYFDRTLKLRNASLHRSRTALLASDHLPIIADFEI